MKKTFGRLTVLSNKGSVYTCTCVCGSTKLVLRHNLLNGRVVSCGCFRATQLGVSSQTHGATLGRKRIPEYGIWSSMLQRCTNPKRVAFKNYGGRGIKVCRRWRLFNNFYTDMGHRPAGKTLDRKDNNGNYTPSNCRWATRQEQSENSRHCRNLTLGAITMTVTNWAKHLKLHRTTIDNRIKRGLSVAQVLSPKKWSKQNV